MRQQNIFNKFLGKYYTYVKSILNLNVDFSLVSVRNEFIFESLLCCFYIITYLLCKSYTASECCVKKNKISNSYNCKRKVLQFIRKTDKDKVLCTFKS